MRMRSSRTGSPTKSARSTRSGSKRESFAARTPTLTALRKISMSARPAGTAAAPALVIGAGGASRAVIHALKSRGFTDIRVANRSVERARDLQRGFGPKVSAHGLEALDEVASERAACRQHDVARHGRRWRDPSDHGALHPDALVTDIVYVPLETPLLKSARLAGLRTADGLGMLLHQARPGFEKWFGVLPDVTAELRQLIIADMERHS